MTPNPRSRSIFLIDLSTSQLINYLLAAKRLRSSRGHYVEKSGAIKDNFIPADNMCG
jgi:hypothetical protein